jgi:hypothetical protein
VSGPGSCAYETRRRRCSRKAARTHTCTQPVQIACFRGEEARFGQKRLRWSACGECGRGQALWLVCSLSFSKHHSQSVSMSAKLPNNACNGSVRREPYEQHESLISHVACVGCLLGVHFPAALQINTKSRQQRVLPSLLAGCGTSSVYRHTPAPSPNVASTCPVYQTTPL